MSKKIEQMLLLMMVMREEAKDVYPMSNRRTLATQVIADLYKVKPQTIRDSCTKGLDIDDEQLDDLLGRLLESGDREILHLLRKHADEKDQADIDEFEKYLKIRHVKIAPSILSADFGHLADQVVEATNAGADYIHVDVMDGHFVPNITIGAPVVAAIRRATKLPLDVHLMIEAPEHHLNQFAEAGADIITVHIEACPHIHRVVQAIKDLKVKAGVAFNPGTPIDAIKEILSSVDLVLLMTVNPGYGGQTFIEGMLDKIARLRAELDKRNLTGELEVDGGIDATNVPALVKAGATVLVAGAAVFNSGESVAEALGKIRARLG